jgi:hypothetical protein
MKKKRKIENELPCYDSVMAGFPGCQPCKESGLPPWLLLCVHDYDMGVVRSQWWAEREYGEGYTR